MNLWVLNPNLWNVSAEKVAAEVPKSASIFWERVKAFYLKHGGRLIEEEAEDGE